MKLRTTAMRAHHPGWAFAPTSGEGARRHGGRFNPIGIPALYLSLDQKTAWLEAQQGFPFKPQPMTLCAYDVDCDDIIDLRDPDQRNAWSLAVADLSCPWEDMAHRGLTPPTWGFASSAIASRQAGAVFPSQATGARPDDVNVVFWKWGEAKPHRVAVIDDLRRLPRDQSSWVIL